MWDYDPITGDLVYTRPPAPVAPPIVPSTWAATNPVYAAPPQANPVFAAPAYNPTFSSAPNPNPVLAAPAFDPFTMR